MIAKFYFQNTFRLLTGCFAVGLFIVAFTISVEICGVDYKSALGIFIQVMDHLLNTSKFWALI